MQGIKILSGATDRSPSRSDQKFHGSACVDFDGPEGAVTGALANMVHAHFNNAKCDRHKNVIPIVTNPLRGRRWGMD